MTLHWNREHAPTTNVDVDLMSFVKDDCLPSGI
jgi:hypothetical protein